VILVGNDEGRTPSLRTGRPHDPEAERVIVARGGGGLKLTAVAGAGGAHAHERVLLVGGAEWLRPSLVAGEEGRSRPEHHLR
jgi:hypothetical protein